MGTNHTISPPHASRSLDLKSDYLSPHLDNQYRWVGLPTVQEILRLILDHDPSQLGQSALRGMIEEGNPAGLARLMEKSDKIFPAFVALLAHEKWPVRLGAIACFDYLVESAPDLAARYIDPLWERIQQTDNPVRGDIAYLLGESGCSAAATRLQSIVQGDFPAELKEAVIEGLENLSGNPGVMEKQIESKPEDNITKSFKGSGPNPEL